ncbi:sensor histidine kinase [Streptomyces sp. NPDC057486]|uniref:sensor histidine kinase n=1 Tax=Streptomyces sp. NPDC057486 TaxID=3346145 RepID=UPI0036862989
MRIALWKPSDGRRRPTRRQPSLTNMAVSLLGMAGLLYWAAQQTAPGLHGPHLLALVLLVVAGLGCVGWLTGQSIRRPVLCLVGATLLGTAGGAMAILSHFGAIVVGIAALYAASVVEPLFAMAPALAGVTATAVSAAVAGQGFDALPSTVMGALLGLLVGIARRQRQVREELMVERERRKVEHERAELLTERTHIAREVHDVLAHTLSALSVQMTVLDSLVEGGVAASEVRAAIGRSRRLVVEGLEETRRAVRVLRDEPVALDEQLAALADGAGAAFQLHGHARSLQPAAAIALLRVAQEALTNARKHAPGGSVSVELVYSDTSTRLVVVNATRGDSGDDAHHGLEATGGGYGLQGMRERVELLGGTVYAGPVGEGWRVEAEVPT